VFRTPVDPVSIPHDIEKRGVTTGSDRKPNPEVNAPIPLPLQVTRSTGSTSQGGDTGSNPVGTTQVRRHIGETRGRVAPHWPRGVHTIVKRQSVFPGRQPTESADRVRFCTYCRLTVARPPKVTTHRPEGPAGRRSRSITQDGIDRRRFRRSAFVRHPVCLTRNPLSCTSDALAGVFPGRPLS
jgi:hypothetical protein